MITALIALALATSVPSEQGGGVAPKITSADMGTEKSAVNDAQNNFAQAQQVYAQSCSDRAYGAYVDLCDQLSKQVHQYRIELDKLEHAAAERLNKPTSARAQP